MAHSEDDPLSAFFASLTASPSATLAAPSTLKHRITSDPQFLPAFLEQLANAEDQVRERELYYFHAITLLHPVLIEAFLELPAGLQEVQVANAGSTFGAAFGRGGAAPEPAVGGRPRAADPGDAGGGLAVAVAVAAGRAGEVERVGRRRRHARRHRVLPPPPQGDPLHAE
mgnify:CR=1 FL=1